MGNECGTCCSKTDGETDFIDGKQISKDPSTTPGGADGKTGVAVGARRS